MSPRIRTSSPSAFDAADSSLGLYPSTSTRRRRARTTTATVAAIPPITRNERFFAVDFFDGLLPGLESMSGSRGRFSFLFQPGYLGLIEGQVVHQAILPEDEPDDGVLDILRLVVV